MKLRGKQVLQLFKTAGADWVDDHSPRLGAALAFYTIFSLAPLLTITISIAALWFSDNASQHIFNELGSIIGSDNAKSLQQMLVQPGKDKQGFVAAISSGMMLFIGATGVFVQLQDSLNEIWEVKPKPGQGVMGFIRHRLLSFAMVLGIAFLLLVSLLLTAMFAAASKYFSHYFGDATWLFQIINNLVSFGLITLLFAMMYKYVPDAKVAWRDVWVGAAFTALLFSLGKFALGMYLGKSSVVSTYSVAGALIVTLLWVYYSAQILFFGAELTQAYAHEFGRGVQPSAHAERDIAKEFATQASAEYRERKKTGAAPALQPPTPIQAPAPAPVAASTKNGTFWKTATRAVVLALVLLPIEKKLLGRAKA
jgi:membrane protein